MCSTWMDERYTQTRQFPLVIGFHACAHEISHFSRIRCYALEDNDEVIFILEGYGHPIVKICPTSKGGAKGKRRKYHMNIILIHST